MTRKDYKAIANAIKHVRLNTHDTATPEQVLDSVVRTLRYVFKADNLNYQHDKFEEACK